MRSRRSLARSLADCFVICVIKLIGLLEYLSCSSWGLYSSFFSSSCLPTYISQVISYRHFSFISSHPIILSTAQSTEKPHCILNLSNHHVDHHHTSPHPSPDRTHCQHYHQTAPLFPPDVQPTQQYPLGCLRRLAPRCPTSSPRLRGCPPLPVSCGRPSQRCLRGRSRTLARAGLCRSRGVVRRVASLLLLWGVVLVYSEVGKGKVLRGEDTTY